jgi:antitoxin CptB
VAGRGYIEGVEKAGNRPETAEVRRKRLGFRSWHRGTREMDLLLGAFADRHLHDFTAQQLARYDVLLELADPDLFAWITGKEAVPERYDTDVMKLLKHFKIPAKPIDNT